MKFESEIKRIYDSRPEYEWERLARHRTEFAVSLRALEEHLPPAPAKILDCGGGPGRYAIELARRGYEVTLFDLSESNIALAKEKAAEAKLGLRCIHRGTATDLSRYANNTFDVVLLMGPLYHLLEESDRAQALAEAYRVLKPAGVFFAAFITRYAPIKYCAVNDPQWAVDNPAQVKTILETGKFPPRGENVGEFVAYFAHPTEVTPLIESAGFKIKTVLGVEGVVSENEAMVNQLTGDAWDYWVDLNYQMAADPALHGAAEHLLAIATKPEP
jgi:ubiquinone/menaquinone biosynthesis C-methylase UbiE